MKLALYGGIAIAMPVILWQIWRFVTPGLYDHEKKYAVPFMVSALCLFVLGDLCFFSSFLGGNGLLFCFVLSFVSLVFEFLGFFFGLDS